MKQPSQETVAMFVDSQQALFDFFYKFYGSVIDGEHFDPAPAKDVQLDRSGSDYSATTSDLNQRKHNRLRRTVSKTQKTNQKAVKQTGDS